jgi:hypothetical protein
MFQLAKMTSFVLKDLFHHNGTEPELVVPGQVGRLPNGQSKTLWVRSQGSLEKLEDC